MIEVCADCLQMHPTDSSCDTLEQTRQIRAPKMLTPPPLPKRVNATQVMHMRERAFAFGLLAEDDVLLTAVVSSHRGYVRGATPPFDKLSDWIKGGWVVEDMRPSEAGEMVVLVLKRKEAVL